MSILASRIVYSYAVHFVLNLMEFLGQRLLGVFMIIGAMDNMLRPFLEFFLAYFMEYFFQKCH